MKTVYQMILLTAVAAVPIEQASAQGSGKAPRFEQIDQNQDGKLSQDEMSAFADARFDAMDTNNDGVVSIDEAQAKAPAKAAERSKKRFTQADKDGNGVVDKDEFSSRRGERQALLFSRYDTDGDGMLSREETQKAWRHKKQQKPEN